MKQWKICVHILILCVEISRLTETRCWGTIRDLVTDAVNRGELELSRLNLSEQSRCSALKPQKTF